ncbi:phage baseplate plug family protein [Rosenbergiella epipactidis]|uniref:phage baseplate plug family protein n=1 Tax=Rosenbergiella epipactidis TaxID=1544694 RepID=UPI001F4DECC4|nr:hypothetical protein [Rosenbergiella epipactidis]
MTILTLGLTPDNQQFTTTILSAVYQFKLIWRGSFWCMDILNAQSSPIILGLPLVTGTDLLGQYQHLGLGFSLFVQNESGETPQQSDLGNGTQLIIRTY